MAPGESPQELKGSRQIGELLRVRLGKKRPAGSIAGLTALPGEELQLSIGHRGDGRAEASHERDRIGRGSHDAEELDEELDLVALIEAAPSLDHVRDSFRSQGAQEHVHIGEGVKENGRIFGREAFLRDPLSKAGRDDFRFGAPAAGGLDFSLSHRPDLNGRRPGWAPLRRYGTKSRVERGRLAP